MKSAGTKQQFKSNSLTYALTMSIKNSTTINRAARDVPPRVSKLARFFEKKEIRKKAYLMAEMLILFFQAMSS